MNPYEPPEVLDAKDPSNEIVLKELVGSWERLRIRYNLYLLPLGIFAGIVWVAAYFPIPAAVFGAFAFGLVANLCFLLGPLVELYWRGGLLDGRDSPGLRRGLFWAGTLFSALIIAGFASLAFLGTIDM